MLKQPYAHAHAAVVACALASPLLLATLSPPAAALSLHSLALFLHLIAAASANLMFLGKHATKLHQTCCVVGLARCCGAHDCGTAG
jgi:prenyltransferase beta subunit